MLIRQYTAEIIEENRYVDRTIFYDKGEKPLPFFHLLATLRTEKYDVVFHTHPRFRLALLTWLTGIPLRVGSGYRWYSFFFNKKIYEHRKDALRNELEYNLNLLKALNCDFQKDGIFPTLEVQSHTIGKIRKLLVDVGITNNTRFIILHPGSGGSGRDWSPRNFGYLGKRLNEIPDTKVIITGKKDEERLVKEVQSIAGIHTITFIDELNLREYAALAKLSSLFIANSTGPLHIAAAVGTPVIGLYSQVTPLSAARWGPYTKNKIIFSPRNKPLDCKKCVYEKSGCCECMDSITVDEVYQGAMKCLMIAQSYEVA